jgi:peptide/nickel transport system substrate-binding protein
LRDFAARLPHPAMAARCAAVIANVMAVAPADRLSRQGEPDNISPPAASRLKNALLVVDRLSGSQRLGSQRLAHWLARRLAAALLAGLSTVVSPHATARDLTIGTQIEVTSLDPHFHSFGPNIALARHVFDTLVRQGPRHELQPGLAESWEAIDDRTWEFRLRRFVRFHDGTDFTAQDVAASLRRAPLVANSPGSFIFFTRAIARIEIVDPHRLRLHTAAPHPFLPRELSMIAIISRRHEAAPSAAFASGAAMVGTGPFRFVEWRPGDRLSLRRNDTYWDSRPEWDGAVIKPIENDSARVAALLSGEVDVIEAVPPADAPTLRARPDTSVTRTTSTRLIYLHMDSRSERAPFVTDERGRPLERNPLRDLRVRRAISKAIHREAIVNRIMDGEAVAASQLLPDDMDGTSPALRVESFDPEGARRLLVDAGYPAGFGITLHGPNNRFANDERVLQTIGSMLNRVGIITRVEAMPFSVFAARNARHEFGVYLRSWLSDTGEPSAPLRGLLATPDRELGMGTTNFGRYSNPALDALLARAMTTLEATARDAPLRMATEIAVGDVGLVPLYFQTALWGMNRRLTHVPRADGLTLAAEFRTR